MTMRDLDQLPGMVLDEGEPVFHEPWEAQAFAMAVGLHEQGCFTWPEWAELLGREIGADREGLPYYELWLRALEAMVAQKRMVSDRELRERSEAWQAALAHTPHGQPVELDNARR